MDEDFKQIIADVRKVYGSHYTDALLNAYKDEIEKGDYSSVINQVYHDKPSFEDAAGDSYWSFVDKEKKSGYDYEKKNGWKPKDLGRGGRDDDPQHDPANFDLVEEKIEREYPEIYKKITESMKNDESNGIKWGNAERVEALVNAAIEGNPEAEKALRESTEYANYQALNGADNIKRAQYNADANVTKRENREAMKSDSTMTDEEKDHMKDSDAPLGSDGWYEELDKLRKDLKNKKEVKALSDAIDSHSVWGGYNKLDGKTKDPFKSPWEEYNKE